MRRNWIISASGHAAVLVFGLITFASSTPNVNLSDFMPVEIATPDNISNATTGVKNAPKAIENPKPLADKIGEPKPAKELAPKVVDKPEIRTDAAAAAEPKPEPKAPPKAAEKSEPKPEPKADAKPAEKAEKQKDKTKPDQIADELKKDDTKKPPKPEKRTPEFKPDQIAEQLRKDDNKKPPSKFDANQVAALLDHREPQRQLAAAETVNGVAALGAPTGHAAHLSQSELDALRAKLISLWNPPPAVSTHPDLYIVAIRIRLGRDHRLIGQPEVLTSGDGPLFEATRDSAIRAVISAQPYDMLSLTTYDVWKEIDINFDPKDVFGG
ncbi:MAG: cell envelope biogenesis protein TolA [Xanthobacteraceae bacterium]